MLFATAFTWAAGLPLTLPMVLGGAFGGALPDIDIEGSAVEKLGSKAASGASTATRVVTQVSGGALSKPMKMISSILKPIGNIINFFLGLIAKAWRWCAEHILGTLYFALYNLFGEKIGWSGDKPWTHRGGLTHSLLFMITALIFLLPVCFLFGSWDFLIGGELGILSHLFADALCRSGVKFFWPWVPPIGFPNREGKKKGDGIRLLPFDKLVRTGCDRLTDDEINAKHGEERRELKVLRRREKAWQKVFQIFFLVFLALIIFGVGPGSATFAAADFPQDASTAVQADDIQQTGSDTQPDASGTQVEMPADSENGSQEATGDSSQETQADTSGKIIGNGSASVASQDGRMTRSVNDGSVTVPEKKGPTSLTQCDMSIQQLPKGIMKMPDETLFVVGGDEVENRESLDKSSWNFSEEDKERLVTAIASKNEEEKRTDAASEVIEDASNAANVVGQGASDAANAVGQGASGTLNAAENSVNEGQGFFGQLLESAKNYNYHGGFIGLTPYTR